MPAANDWITVLLKIAAMFLVILIGWLARRRNFLTAETTGTLSRFVVDITIPAMIVTAMLTTVDPADMGDTWYIPLFGIGILLVGQLVGYLLLPVVERPAQRGTAIFLVAIANWIYLPLPIAEALYGGPGKRAVLLFNVGAQLTLWTIGIWTLRGGKPDRDTVRHLLTNAGLIATVVGIILALFVPISRALPTMDMATLSPALMGARALFDALELVGGLTIPLSLVVTGAQLGGLDLSDHRPSRTLSGVLVARLVLTPLLLLGVGWAVARAGVVVPETTRMVGYIIAAMPVAVSCSIFTERFGGDTSLAARAIFYSTLISIASVPAFIYLIQHLGL